jgi:sigma-B regulation protein RsbU (phosphoserine phosphatase)
LNNFLTALYGHFDDRKTDEVLFKFSRGGHPYPAVYRAGNGETFFLECKGTLIGYFPGSIYQDMEVSLKKGDRVFIYTDGLIDTLDKDGEMIGFRQLLEMLKNNVCETIEETLDSIIDAVNKYRKKIPMQDDLVLIGVEVK